MREKRKQQEIRRALKEITEVFSLVMLAAIQEATTKLDEEKVENDKLSEKYYKAIVSQCLERYATKILEVLAELEKKFPKEEKLIVPATTILK